MRRSRRFAADNACHPERAEASEVAAPSLGRAEVSEVAEELRRVQTCFRVTVVNAPAATASAS